VGQFWVDVNSRDHCGRVENLRATDRNGYAYLAACDRVIEATVRLVHARGIAVSVDIDPDRASSAVVATTHQILLTYERSRRVVPVDHETFMDEEFFRTLVLHQLQAVIEELALSA
jgi:hypothetical protein